MVPKSSNDSPKTDLGSKRPDDLLLTSGFQKYPKYRDQFLQSSEVWLRGKREADDVYPYWRIHNKLYDLTAFKETHPGGAFWIETTRGTDITELYESSHFGSMPGIILKKYFIKDTSTPRNSPYTFHENGFYQTFKRKVTPILAKVGKGPTTGMLLIQDSLFFTFVFMFFAAAWYSSAAISIISGIILALAVITSHNFFHKKDNWRMYIFDFMILSSQNWRITHAISHHVFPNTIYDYEISSFEPLFKLLPKKSKILANKYVILVTSQIMFLVGFFLDVFKKIILIIRSEDQMVPENCIPLIQILLMITISDTTSEGLWLWLVLHLSANFTFLVIGLTGAHHHPDIYHEGDATTEDKDWGLLQIIATRERGQILSSLFLVAVSFGNHTLHHMFPTVDHSKLPYLMPAFLETCKEFDVNFEFVSIWTQYKGYFMQLANTKPNPNVSKFLQSSKRK